MSLSKLGKYGPRKDKKNSEQHRKNISLGKTGKPSGSKGRIKSEQECKNISIGKIRKSLINKGFNPSQEELESIYETKKIIKVFTEHIKNSELKQVA